MAAAGRVPESPHSCSHGPPASEPAAALRRRHIAEAEIHESREVEPVVSTAAAPCAYPVIVLEVLANGPREAYPHPDESH